MNFFRCCELTGAENAQDVNLAPRQRTDFWRRLAGTSAALHADSVRFRASARCTAAAAPAARGDEPRECEFQISPWRKPGKEPALAFACAGSCDDLTVTEEQITIGKRDHDPTEIVGETERPLSFESLESPRGERSAKMR